MWQQQDYLVTNLVADMTVLILLLFLILTLESVAGDKLPPPQATSPVCDKVDKEECSGKIIKTKIYIEDTLWDRMDNEPSDIPGQLDYIFQHVNRHLQKLDNGGFKVEFLKDVVKLIKSEIVLEDTYIDRLNNNKTTRQTTQTSSPCLSHSRRQSRD